MISKERLIDAFGELIYAVAFADGVVDKKETRALHKILEDHPWASGIEWSFRYEASQHSAVAESYQKALQTFKDYGPAPEYRYLIEILEAVAAASAGKHPNEEKLIQDFQHDLVAQFQKDLELHQLKNW